jgi:hypothetical protein
MRVGPIAGSLGHPQASLLILQDPLPSHRSGLCWHHCSYLSPRVTLNDFNDGVDRDQRAAVGDSVRVTLISRRGGSRRPIDDAAQLRSDGVGATGTSWPPDFACRGLVMRRDAHSIVDDLIETLGISRWDVPRRPASTLCR